MVFKLNSKKFYFCKLVLYIHPNILFSFYYRQKFFKFFKGCLVGVISVTTNLLFSKDIRQRKIKNKVIESSEDKHGL